MKIYGVDGTVQTAIHTFCLDREGMPELLPTGFDEVDRVIGGLGPQTCAILGAATGVGKSSLMLVAALNSKLPVGIVSVEDTPDAIGTRVLAYATGIDSLKIRRKDLTKEELKKINTVDLSRYEHLRFAYPIAGKMEKVLDSIKALTDAGCKVIWLDYIQEVGRGMRDDRRNEVSQALSYCHERAAEGNAALIAISQFHRLKQDAVPSIHNLAESGDLERKARIILLANKVNTPEESDRVRVRLAKSMYGGEFVRFDMVRDTSGTLRDATYYKVEEGGW
ncbi:MAG TPA: DnaB-like helicase C-terminal domain-containing protein [Anaerolineae bacterium]|nr:DnaB-like helicase C-terminal domain-containing protein [Anaerolineae bacterium]